MAEWKKLRILGGGTYGIVSLATLVSPKEVNGDIIAVKSSRPNMLNSLEKEGSILDTFLGCKEIIQCFWSQVTLENDHLVHNLLMEYAPFGSLGDLIKRRSFLMESEARVYTIMLLKGLSCIHHHGVVHCDLKPDNILLFPNSYENINNIGAQYYQLKIADFGLSKTKEEEFDPDYWKIKFRGTPNYMSPESVMGQIETPLDIWSLGCIVIEMLTGLLAWQQLKSVEEIMFKLAFLKEAPTIPSGLSLNCKDFLSKCFINDANQRWTANMLLYHPFILSASTNEYSCGDSKKFSMFGSSFFSYGHVM